MHISYAQDSIAVEQKPDSIQLMDMEKNINSGSLGDTLIVSPVMSIDTNLTNALNSKKKK